jgi:hypothetical protein
MTPGEVASLQALAQQHGGSLSINPQTGLPEAGFLSALLPMAAGAGLAAMGMPAGYAALSVGAASAATNGGDMKKAILNGFSAYTGAGLADSFMGAGAAMQSGTATSWMGGEAPVTAAAPTIEMAPSAGSLAGASQQEAINQAGMYRGPSYAAEAGNISLASAAPAEVAQAAAAATPAAQAAQQAASLDTMNMSQRFDALKAGASGTNAMNYIKANPFASLGTATAMLTPDENKTPQKAADTDRGPRANMRYYPGYGTSLPAPNMQGVEQTYNRPYYAAKGGVTRMATGGITSAPRNQQQLFADYLQRVSSSGVAATPPTNKYDWWKSSGTDTPAAAPTETPEQYAARMSLNARGGGGGRGEREPEDPNSFSAQWAAMSDAEKEAFRLENPKTAAAQDLAMLIGSPFMFAYNKLQEYMGPESSTGGPARYRAPPVVPDASLSDIAKTASAASMDPSQQVKALAGYTSAQFSGVEPAPQATPQTSTVDYSTGLYNDLSNRPDSSFPAGTNYTDKAFTRDVFGRVLSPDAPYTSGATTSSNTALVRQNPIAGSDMQRALNSQAKSAAAVPNINPVDPYAVDADYATGNITYTPAEQTRIDRDAAMRSLQIAQERESPDSIAKYQAQVNDLNNKLAALNGEPSAVAQTDTALGSSYNLGPFTNSNLNDSPFNLGPFNAANTAATTAATTARLNALRESIEKSPYEKDIEAQEKRDAAQEEKNAAIQAALESAPSIPFSTSAMPTGTDLVGTSSSPLGTNTSISPNGPDLTGGTLPTINPKDPYAVDSDYGNFERAPYVPGAISAAPDDTTLSQFTNALYGNTMVPANYIGAPIGTYAMNADGTVSDASNGLGIAGVPATNMGNRGSSGVAAGFGGLGSAWRTALGLPVVDGQGRPILTSQGAAQQAYNESPQGVQDANDAENQSLQNRYPSGGRSSDGGDGGDAAGNAAAQTRANDNSATSGGWFGGGSSTNAQGGYLQHGQFDQHMANGGLSAMANPYDLGSYSDGGRLLKGPGDGVSDSIPATIGKGRPARLADGEFVIPARIVSEIGNGSTDAGARKLYAMMDRIQAGRKKSVGKGKVAVNSRADKYLPA